MISFGVGRHFGAAQILPMGCALPKALVKSNHEDGLLFAALSHKTLELLHAVPQQVFNRMDLCQFLGSEDDKDSYFGMFCLIGFKGILGRSVVESVLEIVEGPLQMGCFAKVVGCSRKFQIPPEAQDGSEASRFL